MAGSPDGYGPHSVVGFAGGRYDARGSYASDGGGFALAVKLRVEDGSLPQADLASLAREAHEKICPYSHATRGNVDVQLDVKGA